MGYAVYLCRRISRNEETQKQKRVRQRDVAIDRVSWRFQRTKNTHFWRCVHGQVRWRDCEISTTLFSDSPQNPSSITIVLSTQLFLPSLVPDYFLGGRPIVRASTVLDCKSTTTFMKTTSLHFPFFRVYGINTSGKGLSIGIKLFGILDHEKLSVIAEIHGFYIIQSPQPDQIVLSRFNQQCE